MKSGTLALAWALILVGGAAPNGAQAHRLAPSLLELVELGEGRIGVTWKTPLQQPAGSRIEPKLPPHCTPLGESQAGPVGTGLVIRSEIDCGELGLVGQTLAVDGLASGGTNALVRVILVDGRKLQAVLHAGESSFTVPAEPSPLGVAWGYLRLGFGHILGGLDHCVFVAGLIALVTGTRRLLLTVTSFTLGHSVTLCLAALGVVRFPSSLVEIVIAGTILVLALELARPESAAGSPSAMRRAPWVMAFGFGLLHGLGFAGALAEIGLPHGEIPLALLCFNVGIEIGQLILVAAILAVMAVISRSAISIPTWLLRAPAYAMGGLAVYWCLDRTLELLS